jgi:hypothetical protein
MCGDKLVHENGHRKFFEECPDLEPTVSRVELVAEDLRIPSIVGLR